MNRIALLYLRLTLLQLLTRRLLLGNHRAEMGQLVVLHDGDVLALLVLQVPGVQLLLEHRLLLLHVPVLHVLA